MQPESTPERDESAAGSTGAEASLPLADVLRAAWSAPGASPDIRAFLSSSVHEDESALAALVAADCEERATRNLPCHLEVYEGLIPGIVLKPEARRAVLMQELARAPQAALDETARAMIARFPALEGEIGLLREICRDFGSDVPEAAPAPMPLAPGLTLGKYELIDRLGVGSFGDVWRARDTQLDRDVALKLLHIDGGATSDKALERVMAEARAAAALAHDHIITVHAAGRLDPDGRCYIDTALVGDPKPTPDDPRRIDVGRSFEAFVTMHAGGPPAPGRCARLLAQVCRGVSAAHARGVLHRDIKPANILITPSGRALIGDFGLSTTGIPSRTEAVPPHLSSVFLRSESGRRIVGTPAYMSPEQARGERPTPLSDVYSLGATLRFALTGTPPFAPSGRFSTDARWDVVEQIRQGAAPHSSFGPSIPTALRAIADRAMSPDPERRYASASEMADDLDAWLAHRPVKAMPKSISRDAMLWLRRHAVASGLAAALTLAAASAGALHVVNIRRERDRAVAAEQLAELHLKESESARETSEATLAFLNDMLASPDPRLEGKDVTVLAALGRSAALIDKRLQGKEAVEAAVRTTIGQAYRALEDIKAARPHLDRALEIRERLLGANDPRTLDTRQQIALVTALESRVIDAAELMKGVVAARRAAQGDDHPDTIQSVHDLGSILSWSRDLAGAEEAYREAYERRVRVLGPDDPATLSTKRTYAGVIYTRRRWAESEPIMREVVESHRRLSDPTDVERLNAVNDYATVIRALDREHEALPLLREAYEGLKQQMPRGHIDLLSAGMNLSGLLIKLEKPEEAIPIVTEIMKAADETIGEENTFRWMTHIVYGDALTALGRFEEAENELLPAYERIVQSVGKDGRTARTAATRLVKLYERWEKPELAEKYRPPTPPPAAPASAPAPTSAPGSAPAPATSVSPEAKPKP